MKRKRRPLVALEDIARVVIYTRVSSPEQVSKGHSLDAQARNLSKHGADNGWDIAESFVEPGISARDEGRKVFRKMIEFVLDPKNRVDAILVYASSRFYRNSLKARIEKERLAAHGVRVLSLTNKTEDSPSGRLAERVYEAFDEYESDVNGVRTRSGMLENALKGFLNGSHAPYGFRAAPVNDGANVRRKPEVVPEEAVVVREVFRLYSELTGSKEVARELTRRGIRYRKGSWDKDKVLAVLGNPAAIGRIEWGKVDTQTGEVRPESERTCIPCEPIIEQSTWDLVQQLRAKRAPHETPGQTTASPMLLAGVVKCGRCGSSYTLETAQKTLSDGVKVTHRYYNCRAFIRSGPETCLGMRIPEYRLDESAIDFLNGELFTAEQCREILRAVLSETGGLRQKTGEKRRELETIKRDVERLIQRWESAFENDAELQGQGGPDRYKRLLTKKRELDRDIVQLRELQQPPLDLSRPEVIGRFQQLLRETLRGPDRTVAKRYLRLLVGKIIVHPLGDREAEIEVITKEPGWSP